MRVIDLGTVPEVGVNACVYDVGGVEELPREIPTHGLRLPACRRIVWVIPYALLKRVSLLFVLKRHQKRRGRYRCDFALNGLPAGDLDRIGDRFKLDHARLRLHFPP